MVIASSQYHIAYENLHTESDIRKYYRGNRVPMNRKINRIFKVCQDYVSSSRESLKRGLDARGLRVRGLTSGM